MRDTNLRPAILLACLALLAAALGGCTVLRPAVTAEQAVRSAVERMEPPGTAATMRVVGIRQSEQGTVVLYTYWRPATATVQAMPMFGYWIVKFDPARGGWQPSGGGGGNVTAAADDELITRAMGSGGGTGGWHSVVYGQVLSPKVAAVEATFDSGQVVRDEPTGGAFALVVWEQADWCELRVLGEGGTLLHTISPGPIPDLNARRRRRSEQVRQVAVKMAPFGIDG